MGRVAASERVANPGVAGENTVLPPGGSLVAWRLGNPLPGTEARGSPASGFSGTTTVQRRLGTGPDMNQ